MKPVMNDTDEPVFCGPIAVAAITGKPVSKALAAFRSVRRQHFRKGSNTTNIKGTYILETLMALEKLGWWPIASKNLWGDHTLARWVQDRPPIYRKHPVLLILRGHWVVINGCMFLDTYTKGQWVHVSKAPARRKRVWMAWAMTTKN